MAVQNIEQIQNTEDLQKEVMKIVGLKNWVNIKTTDTMGKISIVSNFISEVYGFFFKEDEKLEQLSSNLEILTSIPNDDYKLTEDIIEAITGINQIVENEKDIPEEFRIGVKTLLIYVLELLQDES